MRVELGLNAYCGVVVGVLLVPNEVQCGTAVVDMGSGPAVAGRNSDPPALTA